MTALTPKDSLLSINQSLSERTAKSRLKKPMTAYADEHGVNLSYIGCMKSPFALDASTTEQSLAMSMTISGLDGDQFLLKKIGADIEPFDIKNIGLGKTLLTRDANGDISLLAKLPNLPIVALEIIESKSGQNVISLNYFESEDGALSFYNRLKGSLISTKLAERQDEALAFISSMDRDLPADEQAKILKTYLNDLVAEQSTGLSTN